MKKFTDEFIKEANYLYRLAEEISDLSINYLDELNEEDKLVNQKLNYIFRAKFNQAMDYLGLENNKSAMQNYLIGLCCLNDNPLAYEFINGLVFD